MGSLKIRKRITLMLATAIASILIGIISNWQPVLSLPPSDDIPEEILRTEIITAARSPIDGKPLTAAQYLELQAKLQVVPPPTLDTKIREQVFLLRLRATLKLFLPFLPF